MAWIEERIGFDIMPDFEGELVETPEAWPMRANTGDSDCYDAPDECSVDIRVAE